MAKNLKAMLRIFTDQRFDLSNAFDNILYALNNEVSKSSKYPINDSKEAAQIRRYIIGNDSFGLDEKELKILQEMALSWGSLEQSIVAINLFLRQYKKGENIGFNIVAVKRNERLISVAEATNTTTTEILTDDKKIKYKTIEKAYPSDNDLHIFLSDEFYTDENGIERRTITPNLVNKIGEFVPATVDTIYYKHLTKDVEIYEGEYFEFDAVVRMTRVNDMGTYNELTKEIFPSIISNSVLPKISEFTTPKVNKEPVLAELEAREYASSPNNFYTSKYESCGLYTHIACIARTQGWEKTIPDSIEPVPFLDNNPTNTEISSEIRDDYNGDLINLFDYGISLNNIDLTSVKVLLTSDAFGLYDYNVPVYDPDNWQIPPDICFFIGNETQESGIYLFMKNKITSAQKRETYESNPVAQRFKIKLSFYGL